jgi:hypothetical protein
MNVNGRCFTFFSVTGYNEGTEADGQMPYRFILAGSRVFAHKCRYWDRRKFRLCKKQWEMEYLRNFDK